MRAVARAEVAAEDRVPSDDYCNRFRSASAEDFNKKHVLCSAHVVGIADPVKYRKRLEAVQKSDGPSYPAMSRMSYNSQELYNKELKLQRQKDQISGTRAWIRIAVARAEVVSQEILELDLTLSNVVWAGGTGGARRQPATYGIVAQGRWSAIAVIWH